MKDKKRVMVTLSKTIGKETLEMTIGTTQEVVERMRQLYKENPSKWKGLADMDLYKAAKELDKE